MSNQGPEGLTIHQGGKRTFDEVKKTLTPHEQAASSALNVMKRVLGREGIEATYQIKEGTARLGFVGVTKENLGVLKSHLERLSIKFPDGLSAEAVNARTTYFASKDLRVDRQ